MDYSDLGTGVIQRLANNGDKRACAELAQRYQTGTAVLPKDEKLADYWYQRSLDNVPSSNTTKDVSSDASYNVTNLFIKNIINWFNECNDGDCFYRNIPESVKNGVRQAFGIGFNEEIIFVRDTSFWNSRDQGLVITDVAIYCIPNNDSPDEKIYLPWEIIKEVVYRDLVLYFFGYGGDNDNCPIHISFFSKSDDENKQARIGRELARIFSSICSVMTPPDNPVDIYYNLKNKGQNEEAFQYIIDTYNKDNNPIYAGILGEYYIEIKDWHHALYYFNKVFDGAEVGTPLYELALYGIESVYQNTENWSEQRKYALATYQNSTGELKRGDGVVIKDDALNDFKLADKEYCSHFLELPYNERKILMPVKEYSDLMVDHIAVLDINLLEKIDFPIGHPIANQLYIGHPYTAHKYLPFENYQLELIEDKVREFCHIAGCLGATEISIDSNNSSSSNMSSNRTSDINGGVDYKLVSAKGGVTKNKKTNIIEEINKVISLHQTFTPTKKPYIPNDTVWYQNEPSWQRLFEQRMNSGICEHEERIEVRKSQMVDNNELTEVKAELQYLFAKANLNWNSSIEEKFALQENAILSIHVKFAPLASLEQDDVVPSPQQHQISSSEQQYLDNIKEFLEDDAEITPRERKMLDRIRQSLGISEERAKELETSLKPQLTEDEQEYLDMYREYAEKGEITEKERNRLNKFATALGISEERMKQLEA